MSRSSPTMRHMFAVIWFYWVGVALAIGAVAGVAAMVVGYLKTVESSRYPKEQ